MVILQAIGESVAPFLQAVHHALGQSVMPLPHSSPCRILCYGDSLTAGFYANGSRFSPYGNVLEETLRTMGVQCEISICGMSGHRADQMLAEIDSAVCRDIVGKRGKGLAYILDNEGPFDLVILMAGTNDFTPHCNLKGIRDAVCQLHATCHERGIRTVMLAAPCNSREMRLGLGQLLRTWANKNAGKVMSFVDPENIIPRSKHVYWEPDQVHFTPSGSRALGKHLARTVGKILEGRRHEADAPAVSPRTSSSVPRKQVFQKPTGQPLYPIMIASRTLMPLVHRGGA